MSKWIAEFDLEDGDTMPEHMDLEYKGAKSNRNSNIVGIIGCICIILDCCNYS